MQKRRIKSVDAIYWKKGKDWAVMIETLREDIFANLMENQGTKVYTSRYGRYSSGSRSKIFRLRRAKAGRERGKYSIADRPRQLDLLKP